MTKQMTEEDLAAEEAYYFGTSGVARSAAEKHLRRRGLIPRQKTSLEMLEQKQWEDYEAWKQRATNLEMLLRVDPGSDIAKKLNPKLNERLTSCLELFDMLYHIADIGTYQKSLYFGYPKPGESISISELDNLHFDKGGILRVDTPISKLADNEKDREKREFYRYISLIKASGNGYELLDVHELKKRNKPVTPDPDAKDMIVLQTAFNYSTSTFLLAVDKKEKEQYVPFYLAALYNFGVPIHERSLLRKPYHTLELNFEKNNYNDLFERLTIASFGNLSENNYPRTLMNLSDVLP